MTMDIDRLSFGDSRADAFKKLFVLLWTRSYMTMVFVFDSNSVDVKSVREKQAHASFKSMRGYSSIICVCEFTLTSVLVMLSRQVWRIKISDAIRCSGATTQNVSTQNRRRALPRRDNLVTRSLEEHKTITRSLGRMGTLM